MRAEDLDEIFGISTDRPKAFPTPVRSPLPPRPTIPSAATPNVNEEEGDWGEPPVERQTSWYDGDTDRDDFEELAEPDEEETFREKAIVPLVLKRFPNVDPEVQEQIADDYMERVSNIVHGDILRELDRLGYMADYDALTEDSDYDAFFAEKIPDFNKFCNKIFTSAIDRL